VVVDHPSCSRFLARKLCRFFVADEPPPGLVDATAGELARTGGEIAIALRTILLSDAFRASAGKKLKRPFRFVVSALRALGADVTGREGVPAALVSMGQAPFHHPTPDGYPEHAEPWLGTLLFRWNFALALVEGRLPGASVDLPRLSRALGAEPGRDAALALTRHLLGREPDDDETNVVLAYLETAEWREHPERAVALVLSSPGFQSC